MTAEDYNEDIKKVTEANREAWNEVVPIHLKNRPVDLCERFKEKNFSTLDEIITDKFNTLGIEGKDIAQLCCNNGRETISLLRMGARTAVGFDISDEAVAEARQLAAIAEADCRFVRTDVYDIDREYYNRFDLIYISIGALPWLPDLPRFFEITSAMLRPGGHLVIYESHPVSFMLASEGDQEYDPNDPAKIVYSYFRKEPWVDNDGIDYYGKTSYKAKTTYNYTIKLMDILNPIIKGGLEIIEFDEYPHDTSVCFEHIAGRKLLPLSFILIAGKNKTRTPTTGLRRANRQGRGQ